MAFEKKGKEDWKTTCLFSGEGGSLNTVGVVLSLSVEESFVGLSRGGVWTETTPREGGLEWNPPEHTAGYGNLVSNPSSWKINAGM